MSAAVALAVSLLLVAFDTRADDSAVRLSLSIERVAGVAYGHARPTSPNESFTATVFGIGEPAIGPIALPRLGADVLLPVGLTLGGAVGYSMTSLTVSSDGDRGPTFTGNAWLLSPRIGYLRHLGPLLDVWPRVGVTFARGSLRQPDSQACSAFKLGTSETCMTLPGETDSLLFVAASVDVAAALRLTRSFNLLGGIAYDQVFSTSASTNAPQNGAKSSAP